MEVHPANVYWILARLVQYKLGMQEQQHHEDDMLV